MRRVYGLDLVQSQIELGQCRIGSTLAFFASDARGYNLILQ